jgi:hypothetical protein
VCHPQTFHKLYQQMIFNNKQTHILKKQFLLHMILLERIFGSKEITIALLDGFDLFGRLIIHFPSQWTIYFLFNVFEIIKWFAFTCFFNVVIPFICLSFKVTKQDWIIITNNTFHDLSTFHINILVIIQNQKTLHKEFLPCDL